MTHSAGNALGPIGGDLLAGAVERAAIVVTTSTWCSLDACVAGNEESHTLHPFKAKRVCGSESPSSNGIASLGTLNYNFRPHSWSAEDTLDIQSSVSFIPLHVNYIIIIVLFLLHLHLKDLPLRLNSNGLLHPRITPAVPRTTPPFVILPVPWRRGKKQKPPW